MTFRQVTFWGGLDYVAMAGTCGAGRPTTTACSAGDRGSSTPPTGRRPSVDETGRDLRTGTWLDAATTAAWGVRLYHYSLLLPKQVIEKCDYYANADWARRTGAVEWANEAYLQLKRPFRVHNVFAYPSWLERFRGPHPVEVVAMVDRLRAVDDGASLRRTDDIERLLERAVVPRRSRGRAGGRPIGSGARLLADRSRHLARRRDAPVAAPDAASAGRADR